MITYAADLHIHSCLSPCADDDMTPANIAGMAYVQELKIAALTDHNSSKNCPAFFYHAERYGVIPVAGMELTTSEEIHVVCLFPTLEGALKFDEIVSSHRAPVKNRAEIFGRQLMLGTEDEIVGEEEFLLINAVDIDSENAYAIVHELGGVCFPAHIDRDSGGIISVLGTFPTSPPFTAYELRDMSSEKKCIAAYPSLSDKIRVVSSDAHSLESVARSFGSIELDTAGDDAKMIRAALISRLRGEG